MIPLQGIILVSAVLSACRAEKTTSSSNRKPRQLPSFTSASEVSFDPQVVSLLNSYLTGEAHFNNYQNLGSELLLPAYNAANSGQPSYEGYRYGTEGVKRYAVKEDVDEGFVTTPRTVYLPRPAPRAQNTPGNGWTPIQPNLPRTASGKSFFVPNLDPQSNPPNQISLPITAPQTPVKTSYVQVEKVVGVPVPEPYSVPVYQPYPVAVPQPYPLEVPLPVEVHSTVTLPVEKPVPIPVIKPVPYNVVKNEHVPVPVPYPVPVPVYKTKYIVHSKTR